MENNWLDNNVELLLLIVNWGVVAIQAFTIFVSGGGNWILFIIMLCAVAGQAISTVIHRRKMRKNSMN